MKITFGTPGDQYVLVDGEAKRTWPGFLRIWLNWRGLIVQGRTKAGIHRWYRSFIWWPWRPEDDGD